MTFFSFATWPTSTSDLPLHYLSDDMIDNLIDDRSCNTRALSLSCSPSCALIDISDDREPWSGRLHVKSKLRSSWPRADFILHKKEQKLLCYANNKRQIIDISRVVRIEILNDNGIFLGKPSLPHHLSQNAKALVAATQFPTYSFQLVLPGKTWTLRADNKTLFCKWLEHIRQACFGGIVRESYIHKLNSKGQSVKRLYVVLHEQNLKYYANNSLPESLYLGTIPLSQISQIQCHDKAHMRFASVMTFKVAKKLWIFGFNTVDDRNHWYTQIIDRCGDGGRATVHNTNSKARERVGLAKRFVFGIKIPQRRK